MWYVIIFIGKIVLTILSGFFIYVSIRIASFAVFKSWLDAHKPVKEDKNGIQRKSKKIQR